MHYSRYGALMGFLGHAAAGVSPAIQADNIIVKAQENEVRSSSQSCSYDLNKSWVDETFYSGIISASTDVADAVELGLMLPEAALEGSIDVSCGDDFLVSPVVKVDLGGVKAYLRVALDATAGVDESVNLVTDLSLTLAVPGLASVEIDVGIALDLVFSVSAAIDIDTIFNVQFPEGCYLEVDIFTKEIVSQELTGLIIESLPQSIGAFVSIEEDIDLSVALRLRTGLAVSAGLDILGLDIGAGAEVAIWANLFEYTAVISQGESDAECSASEEFSLSAGVAIEVDVEIGELDLSIAPDVIVTLSTAPSEVVSITLGEGCGGYWPWREGGVSSGTISGSGSSSGTISGSGSSSGTISGSGSESGSDSGSGSYGAEATLSGSAGPVATGSISGSIGSGSESGSTGSGSGSGSISGSNSGSTGSGSTGSGSTGSGSGSGSESGSSAGSSAPSATFSDSPVQETGATTLPSGMTTSTVYETHTYTMTSCAASVKNCPATYTQQVVTAVVQSYTTICPVTATEGQASTTQGASAGSSSAVASSAATSTADVQGPTPTASVPSVKTSTVDITSQVTSTQVSTVTIPAITSTKTLTPCETPVTSTQVIPTTVTTPAPTVVITEAYTPPAQTATATAGATAATGAWSNSPVYTSGPAPVWPSGAAGPTGFSTRPYNGTISRPTGVPAVTSGVVGPSSTSSSAGHATTSAIVTAGAGKVGFGLLAAFAPIFVALM